MNQAQSNDGITVPHYVMSHRAPLYFLIFSIFAQVIGIGLLSLVKDVLSHPGALLALQAVTAFIIARWLKLSLPWQLFNLLLPPAIIVYASYELPQGLALGALIFTLLLYAPTFWTRVPYFPTAPALYDEIVKLLPSEEGKRVIDIGCGMGRLLSYLAGKRPDLQFVGVEISPLAFLFAKILINIQGRKNVTILLRNFWNLPLGDYDLVYAFLSPGPMPALWEKAQEEMKKGSVFVTNTFKVEADPHDLVKTSSTLQSALYVHRF